MLSTTVFTLVLGLLLYLGKRVYDTAARERFIASHGCRPPARYPQKDSREGGGFGEQYDKVRSTGNYLSYMREQFSKLGSTWSATVGKETWFFTCDPDNIRAIATAKNDLFAVEPSRKPRNAVWIGDGMAVSDGAHWKMSRGLFKPMFARAEYANLERYGEHVDRLLNLVPEDGSQVDLQPLLKRLYLDVSTELFFGEPANALGDGGKTSFDIAEFEGAFETAMGGMGRKVTLGSRIGLRRDEGETEWRQSCAKVHKVFDDCIDRAMKGREKSQENESGVSMVHGLAQAFDDRLFIRNELLNVFIGAKDTAAIGISNVFFHLARNPEVWARLRQEVSKVSSDMQLTFERLKALTYLRGVINESLRLLSPVIMSIRHVKEDTVLPKGGGPTGDDPIFLAAGSRVEVNLAGLHYNRRVWGDSFDSFDPDRWEDLELENWQYLPFLGGNRICPAQHMVLTQYSYLLATFVRRFAAIERRDPVHEYEPEIVFSQQSKNGVKVAFRK